ncbi:type II CRISPR RNA-guided endonuclease Cas9 [Schleiferia thermophila]|uniref:type II CRISPR RNA-guided endonuclease Cas9 n=1 Tax=Schleiferia thermophila TaxID=884107 RepID=UPI003EE9C3D4
MKILGLDLGTNSIGWAIRETDRVCRKEYSNLFKNNLLDLENEIVDYGVIVFKKGVGNGKSGEFSLAAERRKNRSKRRLYNAKRYRKWELLKVLIDNNLCPLTIDELKLWSVGEWVVENGKKRNKGRKYPMSADFLRWLAMDFDKIGTEFTDGEKLKPEFENPYTLRCFLLERKRDDNQKTKYQIGRALYHLAQRRGFKSSRKSGMSTYAENKEIEQKKNLDSSYSISKYAIEKIQSGRFRASGVIQRKYYEEEFLCICKTQGLEEELTKKLFNAVYYVRPLRSQKGLVGKCTLEKNKTRIPISHPVFEEFRALAYINTIQWRVTGSNKPFEPIPIELKKKILEQLFFRKKRNGEIDTRGYFRFDEIIKEFSENFKYEFNYAKYKDNNPELSENKKISDLLKANPNITACPVIAGLMNVFWESWKNKFITDDNKFGIDWSGLKLDYTVKYGRKKGEKRQLDYESIWHLLFDYILTKDDIDKLRIFCNDVLGWNKERIDLFVDIGLSQGYGSLSKNAIKKIIPYLQQGFIYSEAVLFANLEKVLGQEKFVSNKEDILKTIAETIKGVDIYKEKLHIVNSLIQKYFGEVEFKNAKGLDETIIKSAEHEVINKLKEYFGEKNWNIKSETEKKEYYEFVLDKYLTFLDGKQKPEEKASTRLRRNPEIDYYLLPRLDECVKNILSEKFSASDEGLKHLYHPSDIDVYPKAKNKRLGDPVPPSKGWKNPMAMRTMHELKKLINYLLEIGKIDEQTKIVVEMARELNDANLRWAIKTYQKQREEENKEFAKIILGLAQEKYPNLNENDVDNIDKVRLWWEQLPNGEEIYRQVKELKDDVLKYRLWKEQKCQCIYTGKWINITDLFDGTKVQFEHTFPLSDSFDNSLANLTVCDAHYNMNVKQDRIPTQLENYNKDAIGYSAIEPRLKKWFIKRDTLKERIENNKVETKKAIRIGNIERKNYLIRERHLLQFEFDYWDKKLKTFTLKEIPNWWKNSQLIDTQIITKYSSAYLKSLFTKVDVVRARRNSEDIQDGTVNIFEKIYGIKGDEQKDRGRHSHHAIDAAVLTLIPSSTKREEIIKQYFKENKSKNKFHMLPYQNFDTNHILQIEKNIIVNHIFKDKTLVRTKKKVRKRGLVQYTSEGKPMIMQGNSIRGQLHKETFYGAVLVPERNENGYIIKENDKVKLKENEVWIVYRKPIQNVDINEDIIVDELLKKHIQNQINKGVKITAVKDFRGKLIRHLRCRAKAGRGYLTKKKTIELKKNSSNPKKLHKQFVLTQNEENYLYLLYENNVDSKKICREARIVSLFEMQQLLRDGISIKKIWKENELNQLLGLPLRAIIKVGYKVIFYEKNKEELKELKSNELQNRVFIVYKFNEIGSPYIYLQNHIDARIDDEFQKLSHGKDGYTEFDVSKYQYRLKLKARKLNCVFERIDFEIKPDGELIWKF